MIKLKSVFFTLLFTLFACVQAWAVESYRKVTTLDDLVDGANCIMVTKLQSAAYAPGTLNNSVFASVEITFESDIAIIDQNSEVTVFTLQKTNDGYAFMNNGQYLYSPENKKVGFREEETSWQVTAQSGGFAISPSAGYLQYNASKPRFTVYTSDQTPAYLYVKSDEYSSIMPPVISGTTPFKHSTTVSISAKAGETIYYTLDGTEPTTSSAVYTAPFELVESTQVKAIAQNGEQTSVVANKQFEALPLFMVSPDLDPETYYGQRKVYFTLKNGTEPYDIEYTIATDNSTNTYTPEGVYDNAFSVIIGKTATVTVSATDAEGETFTGSFAYTILPYEDAKAYQLVKDLSALTANSRIIFAAEKNGAIYVMGTENFNDRFLAVRANVEEGAVVPPRIILNNGKFKEFVVRHNEDGTYSFSSMVEGEYLQPKGKNTIALGPMSERAHAVITFNSEKADISFENSEYNLLRFNYNHNANWLFSCYNSSFVDGLPVYIYAKADLPVSNGAVTIAADRSWATINGAYKGAKVVDISEPVGVDTIIFNRTFTEGAFSTIMLPFEIAVSSVSGGKFFGFTEMTNENGKWTAGASEIGQSGTLAANTPYLVKPMATSITFKGPVMLSTIAGGSGKTVRDDWEFQGTYEKLVFGDVKEANPQNTYYGFVARDTTLDGKEFSAGQFVKAGPRAYIYPMRAYLVHNGVGGSQKNAGGFGEFGTLPETIDLKIMDENGVVTETATLNTRTGEIKRDRWYDLQGRLLNGKPAEKGKYLHNGRVEVVK